MNWSLSWTSPRYTDGRHHNALTMKCDFFSLTDTGRVRANNEDAVAVVPALGLVVLADGMGGYNAGEVA
ncbi:hypothetical protein RZS08_19355, partial [Arthrospira platensis SPKY1]|nr:hypothetical protein [Arthrospira platensis SPKY1]